MIKIAFIGAGSLEFTRNLARDILSFPLLQDAQIALMDINPQRLEYARQVVMELVEAGGHPAKVTATLERREALQGADVVLVTILAGSTEIWRHDIEIPMKYGVDINVGDTRGPSGIFRFLRTLPAMMEIVRDMEQVCPRAILLNHTNPLSMLSGAVQRQSFIRTIGLCHSVQITAMMLSIWIGALLPQVSHVCAGINHLAWYLKFEENGQDAYPRLHQAITGNPDIYNAEKVRNEMYLALGYYVTESSGHNSEYNWWFRKRPDLIEKYCTHGTGWNPGEHAYILKGYQRAEEGWKNGVQAPLVDDAPEGLFRGVEYAPYIINALQGGEAYQFNGNVPNTGLITNLPAEACVEVPVKVDGNGFQPLHVGALPPQLALLTGLSCGVEELAIQAAIAGDPLMVYQAICHDPLTASVLSLEEIRRMTNELFDCHKEHLPQFKIHKA